VKKQNLAVIFAAVLSVAPFAKGQDASSRIPLNLPGVSTSLHPPEGFSAIDASDEELARYGFPPRPDAQAKPQAYASWQRAMLASKVRLVPELEMTAMFAGPNRKQPAQNADASTGTSSNWSGSVDFSGAKSYNSTTSFYYIVGEYVVPVARQAYGACTGAWDYSVQWVGIDGDGSSDVLQAGTEADAYCSGNSTSTYYSAWYEWFPNSWTRISNFAVVPGDDLFVEVWHTSATQGYAYIVNYNTDQAVEIGFTAPSGTRLIGNSAEWVVERPGVGGGLATLTNYISDYFSDCYAETENYTQYVPGSAGALQLTMLDNSNNPISYPTLLGTTAIWFQDEGSAR